MSGTRMDLANRVSVPDVLIQPHSAPLGLAFYQATQFPLAYRGDAFVALRGSWNRAQRTGYKVVRLRFQDGHPTGVYQDFLTGFVLSDQAVWGRPVGLTVMQDGSLLVSEDANGHHLADYLPAGPMSSRAASVRFILITLVIDALGFGLVVPIVPSIGAEAVGPVGIGCIHVGGMAAGGVRADAVSSAPRCWAGSAIALAGVRCCCCR